MNIQPYQHYKTIHRLHFFSLRNLAKIPIVLSAALFLSAPEALAQERESPRSWGYFFAGIGSCNHGYGFLHTGGGGQGLLTGGLGVNAEVGYFGFLEAPGNGVGIFSPGIVYSFNRSKKTVPFVTGGYSLWFREGIGHGVYFGGGVDRWMSERWGIRIEGRDQVLPTCNEHLLEARFAIIIR